MPKSFLDMFLNIDECRELTVHVGDDWYGNTTQRLYRMIDREKHFLKVTR